ncbi:hypothetical protein GCM10027073_60650 [Streptomyces chlorus]
MASPEIDGAPGGVAQVREVADALIRASKERGMPTILVGHVAKDGAIAGPRLLEHLVDVVLHFEGDRHARLRLARGVLSRPSAGTPNPPDRSPRNRSGGFGKGPA